MEDITVIFPKVAAYNYKSLDYKREVRKTILASLEIVKESGCGVRYFIEDKLAHDFIQESGITRVQKLTGLSNEDLTYLTTNVDEDDPLDESYNSLTGPGVINLSGIITDIPNVDFMLRITNPAEYTNQLGKNYKKRRRKLLDKIVELHSIVLNYRTGDVNDRCKSPISTAKFSDGRLLIEVDIKTGTTAVYFGGVFVPSDALPDILKL